ncbi:Uncharacterized amino-acid permease C15C4.04c [Triticum urartu]|uniref:Uncharacterized amino-acid permease C15C4.04c n=2 Tax=Triticum urartu TaxID=4572 RepID=M7Z7Q7_TRIUA|nr:Uncharacterized amino-acid permease C15C4.04c [Triticum urartu]
MPLGWLVVAFFNGCVALSMAEICSAYPTSGGLYYWSAKLAGNKWASLASWVTGSFNIVGQWASTTSVDFSLALLIQVIILLGTGGANGGGYRASKYVALAIYGLILVLHGLINSLPIHWLSWFGKFGAFWNPAGLILLAMLCFYRFNIVGQWATATSVDFSLAQLIQVIILLATGGTNGGGYVASKYVVLAIYGFILILHGLINSLPIHWLSWFGQLGAFWNAAGVLVLVILIPSVAKERSSADFIFTHLNTDNGMGIHNKAYILGVGLLMSNYCMIGYDTSAHMTEETKNADRSGPIGIVTSVVLSNIFGWIYLVTLTSVVTDIPYLLSADNDAGGYAIAQALHTIFNQRYGSGVGGLVCLGVIAVAMFLCGVASITSNSRMGYAFSRDGAMPYSHLWHRVTKHEVPLNIVWLSVLVAFAMALTSLGSQVAFQAMVSIATLGLYISYALPIFFRVTTARKSFVRGPFHLGRYGVIIGWAAVLWVVFITVLFSLPVAYPVGKDVFNYTPVAVGGVLLLSVGSWVFHARFWFKGPIVNVDTY